MMKIALAVTQFGVGFVVGAWIAMLAVIGGGTAVIAVYGLFN